MLKVFEGLVLALFAVAAFSCVSKRKDNFTSAKAYREMKPHTEVNGIVLCNSGKYRTVQ